MAIKSRKLKQSAKGEECTFNIVGVCNYNEETVVLCHLPDESKGMGKKSDDISSAYGCYSCHDAIDGRKASSEYAEHSEWYMRRAQTRTLRRFVEQGLVKVL